MPYARADSLTRINARQFRRASNKEMKPTCFCRVWLCAFALVLTNSLPCYSHTLPISYLTVVPDADHVHVELAINPFELNFLPAAAWEDARALEAQKDAITKQLVAHLQIRSADKTIDTDSAGVSLDDGSHHITFLAHYPIKALQQPLTINSTLTEITSVSHITEVTYRGASGEQMARLDVRNTHAEFSPVGTSIAVVPPAPSGKNTGANTFGVALLCLAIAGISLAIFIPARRARIAVLLGFCLTAALTQAQTIWTMGQTDDLSAEFAPGSRDQAKFNIEKGVLSRDFPGNQAAGRSYSLTFSAKPNPGEIYDLVIDFIFHSASPNQMQIELNGRRGIFPILQTAKGNAATKREENEMLLTRGRLIASLRPEWFANNNTLTLTPIGIGSLHYDSLKLERRTNGEPADLLRLEPTIFFTKTNGTPCERCELMIPFGEHFSSAMASVELGGKKFEKTLVNCDYDFGVLTEPFDIPASIKPGDAHISVTLDNAQHSTTCAFKPAKQWKVFICPKVHNDVGYTDLQPHVNELDNRNTDTVLDVLAQHPEYKFNFETSWLVDNYLNCRTLDYCKQFYYEAAKKRATVNALYLNLMTGVCSGEELYRALYFTHRLHREHNANFDFACLTDAPSHSWFLPTLLSDVGIKAFSNGSNQTRAPILHYSDLNENSPFYWEGMNGEKIMMWYALSYRQLSRLIGADGGPEIGVRTMEATVPQFLTRFMREDYNPDAVMIYGAYVDNAAIPKNADAPVIEAWNKQYEFPKLIVGSDGDYFSYIEKNFSDKLRTYRGDCGAYWEDGVASSAKATALNRQSQRVLPAAETTAALASILQSRNRYPSEDFQNAWKNVMFYDEHTWGAHNSIAQPDREFVTRQWEIKESYATHANLDARTLLARACNRFVQNIAADNNCVVAFNLQPWMRTAALEVELDHNQVLIDPATDKPVPMDVLSDKDNWKRIRFLATDVPAFGYKCFSVRGGGNENKRADGDTIENAFYRLTIDTKTGGIKTLFDKTEQRELADTNVPYTLNETLYASGGEDSRILNHNWGSAPVDLKIDQPTSAKIVENVKTPLGQRIVVITSAKNLPKIRSEYVIYDAIKRIDVINTLDKEETRAKEAVYFAYPFAATDPRLEYQIQNGWVRPNDDQMPGACREWFTSQNLVHVSDGDFSIAWSTPDAPLFTLTDINRGIWPTYLKVSNGHVYSYVMNNYWFTNYRATQGGTLRFCYSITSGKHFDRQALARFDADTRTPIVPYGYFSVRNAKVAKWPRPLGADSSSLLSIDTPNLQIVTMKAAEDGDGYILRLQEVAGQYGEAELRLPLFDIDHAFLCNGVEDNQQRLKTTSTTVKVPYKANAFTTVRLKLSFAPTNLAQH